MAKRSSSGKSSSKKKASPKPSKTAASEPAQSTLLMPNEKLVQSLSRQRTDAKKKTSAINGELGSAVNQAAQEKHLDKKAHGIAHGLSQLPDEKLHITYFHLMKYLDDLGVTKRATAQSELFGEHKVDSNKKKRAEEEGESEAGEGEAAEAGGDEKVVSIGTAARRVAETAGDAAAVG